MNESTSDQVLESFLEEMLTERHPPDLSARIVDAWRREKGQAGQVRNPLAESDLLATEKPLPAGNIVEARPVKAGNVDLAAYNQPITTATGSVELSAQGELVSAASNRGRVALSLAMCAAILLCVLSWFGSQNAKEQGNTVAGNDAGTAQASSPDSNTDLAGSDRVSEKLNEGSPQTLELDDLPFSTSNAVAADDAPESKQPVGTVEKLDSGQLVAELDRRLLEMWTNVGVTPSADYGDEVLAQRISIAMTGQELPISATGSSGESDKFEIAREGAASIAFARKWSDAIARLWFERSSVAVDGDEVTAVRRVIADRIANGQPWNEVVLDLLGGDLNDQGAINSTFIAALAGGENHRLVERIGTNFLDANLACVRCHDSPSGEQSARALRQLAGLKQENYWTMVALLKGVDARNENTPDDNRQRVVIDRQSELFSQSAEGKVPSVFYDLPNGVLKSAEAKLPDGSDWATLAEAPRKALAKWISQSPDADRATVNQVWKLVFGRSLVPRVSQSENVAFEDRVQLLDFMAGQFRAHDHDLRKLVGWIVTSQAFAKQSLNLGRSQWLQASDADLEDAQLRELVFAAGPSLGRSTEARSLESSLAAVVQWTRPLGAGRNSMLAQPNTLLDEKKLKRLPAAPADLEMPSMSFVLHGQQHTVSQQAFVNRLLRAERLSWEERVQHVVGLGGTYSANGRVQQLAKELLEQNSGDARDALLDLLWAVQNSDASS